MNDAILDELRAMNAELKAEMKAMKAELNADLKAMKAEMADGFGRISVQIGDLAGDVVRLQATVSQSVDAFAEVWTGFHRAASALDVPDPEPGAPLDAEVDDLREGMRSASRALLDLPEPPKPGPQKPKRSKAPKLGVLPGGRKNPGGPKRPRKPRGK